MDKDIIVALIALSGVLATGFITLIVQRSNQRTQEITQMRSDFMGEIRLLREEVNTWRDRALKLEDENKELEGKVRDLEKRLFIAESGTRLADTTAAGR